MGFAPFAVSLDESRVVRRRKVVEEGSILEDIACRHGIFPVQVEGCAIVMEPPRSPVGFFVTSFLNSIP